MKEQINQAISQIQNILSQYEVECCVVDFNLGKDKFLEVQLQISDEIGERETGLIFKLGRDLQLFLDGKFYDFTELNVWKALFFGAKSISYN